MTKVNPAYDVVRDLKRLRRRNAHIATALKTHGYPLPRLMAPGFSTLIRIIAGQQVSTASAKSIWARLQVACEDNVTPEHIVAITESGLRSLGFSSQKARCVSGLAEATVSGHLDFLALTKATDDDVRSRLTAFKGVGNWTADIYLMFGLGRGDIWPAADIGLHSGIQILHGLDKRPTAEEAAAFAEAWRPYRSSAAVLMWHFAGMSRKTRQPVRSASTT